MIMTLEEFVKKYNGVKIDFDNYGGAQCVDLFRQYLKDVYGIKEPTGVCGTSGGAKDLYLDYPKMPLEKKYLIRSATKLPKEGDIVIWDSSPTNEFGHVAICLGKLGSSIIVFEQNGFKQDGAKLNVRSKDYMLGILSRK